MRKFLKHWPLTLAALLALCCGLCVWRLWAVSNLLDSQKAARRWQGTGERSYAQVTCLMPPLAQMTLDDIYKFRGEMLQKLKGAGYDIENDRGLYADAWSGFASAKVSSGRQSGEVQLVAVGGNFFDFHPLRLLSGNYLSPDDVMDDRVLLDSDTAWLLFGAWDVAGMSFSLEGVPMVVAGVYEQEKDVFSQSAYGGGNYIYMSFSAYQRFNPVRYEVQDNSIAGVITNLFSDAVTSSFQKEVLRTAVCYEILMAEPVKGFTYSSVTDKFPAKNVVFVENTYRFTADRLLSLAKHMITRSMQVGGIYFPYWENAARAAEDRALIWAACALVTGAFPIALLIYELIRSAVHGKKKLEQDVLPGARRKSREFVREQSRRRWERKHPEEAANDDGYLTEEDDFFKKGDEPPADKTADPADGAANPDNKDVKSADKDAKPADSDTKPENKEALPTDKEAYLL